MNTLLWTLVGSALCIVYTEPVSADVPCCKKCQGEGGVCSTSQPSPEYMLSMNESKCIGTFQGAPTYCGYCWKKPELGLPCTKRVCAEGKGICSPIQPPGIIPDDGTEDGPNPPPTPAYSQYGFCGTSSNDCKCWVHYTFFKRE
ncbi:uncharacterized protein LOC111710742 [Eurytemora carolleeae]|uniref:uncharacterized protein LOC111710742 n=1 Tax=Eurytemora carolleeae TaxID=1294199 RepID=UPI000C7788EF|nr:uncharacterized protein LOC111710742 [Eurytemora carolleeae]|eukprot:XP_023340628.1 uncharacterized protein LOC111710742 [Eurytemora affinis]